MRPFQSAVEKATSGTLRARASNRLILSLSLNHHLMMNLNQSKKRAVYHLQELNLFKRKIRKVKKEWQREALLRRKMYQLTTKK